MADLNPPSAELLPPPSALRQRLAIALREVNLLRRLIRVAESVRHSESTVSSNRGKGADRG